MSAPRMGSVVFDCRDATRLAAFWADLLDTRIAIEFPGFIWLEPPAGTGVALAFQEVPDPTPGKNKLHVDAHHVDLEAVSDRVMELGGSFVASHEVTGFTWNVYADPEDNQFCVGHEIEPG